MEEKKSSCDSVFDHMPPLSLKYPWFIAQYLEDEDNTSDGRNMGDQTFFSIHKPMYQYHCRIPELHGRYICAFFYDWAILSNYSHENITMWSLWNPVTSKLICLPPLQGAIDELCLSSPPGDPGSVFLVTGDEEPTITFCRLDCKRKKFKWTKISYAKQLRSAIGEDGFLHCLSSYNSKVYALHRHPDKSEDFVIQVDIVVKEKEVVINLLPFLEIPRHTYSRRPFINRRPSFKLLPSFIVNHFLKGSSTGLFFIEIGFEDDTKNTIIDVYLFKLDFASMTWKEMEDLKDDIFFIDLTKDCSIYYTTSSVASEVGGCINILDAMGKILYSYHVKDRTISLSYMPSLVQTSVVSMLEFRFEDDHSDSKQEEEDKGNEIVVRPVTDDEGEFNNTTDESHLFNILFHLLEMIMEFCGGEEYMKFRASCKRCHLAAPLIQSRLQTFSFVSPWLIMLDKHQGFITFTDPIFGDKYFIKTPQELIKVTYILCHRFGWLLMIKRGGSFVFFNPFTREIHELQHSPEFSLESCWFSAPPSSPDCMLVGFDSFGWQVYIHYVAREPCGRVFHLNLQGDDPFFFGFPTYYEGYLYALCNEGELYVFRDLGKEEQSWGPLVAKTPRSICEFKARYYLVKCDASLLLVIVSKFGESVEVFKLNDLTKEWEKIDDLGKHTIYIGDTTCVCIEAKTRDIENKIYFPRLHNKKIVFYSLATCTYWTLNGKNNEGNLRDFKETSQPCCPSEWIGC